MPFLLGAFTWFRSTWLGKALAVTGAVLIAILFVYRKGKSDARKDQKIKNLEEYADVNKRAREREVVAARRAGQLDDSERADRLREHGGLRKD